MVIIIISVLKYKFDTDSKKLATLTNSSTFETSSRCNVVVRRVKIQAQMVQIWIQQGNSQQPVVGEALMHNK